MGRATLARDGIPQHLEPRAMAVLIRLTRDLGQPVRLETLITEVIRTVARRPGSASTRDEKLYLYRCVSQIRKALDPQRGKDTELLTKDHGRNSGYQLNLSADAIDATRFERLILDSYSLGQLHAMGQLRSALDLWTGRPLVDVVDFGWAGQWVAHLEELRDLARSRLIEHYQVAELYGEALDLAASIVRENPDDREARALLASLAGRGTATGLNRRYPTGIANTEITVRVGDLLAQDDAHLVIGFGDTFETDTVDNLIVSRSSLNGQLVHGLYAGAHEALDKEIAAALANVPSILESRTDKPSGNLRRYPVGTVATLNQANRHIFALAYSRIGNDNRASSSLDDLGKALSSLWPAVEYFGQRRPIALGVLGSGLARIDDQEHPALIELIVSSFLQYQAQARTAEELRIIVQPRDADRLSPGAVETAVLRAIEAHARTRAD